MKPLVFILALLVAGPVAAQAVDGAALYKRCAACHLPGGAGVPGAFPPLQSDFLSLAKIPDGRRYLALVILRGVSGPLVIDGKTYRGFMPAQSALNDAEIAAVLNHVGTDIAKGKAFRAFAEAEVTATRQSAQALTSGDIGALHPASGSK
nr:cytochrome c [Polymorphobacter sp.]